MCEIEEWDYVAGSWERIDQNMSAGRRHFGLSNLRNLKITVKVVKTRGTKSFTYRGDRYHFGPAGVDVLRHALRRVTCHINLCLVGETKMDGDDLFCCYLFILSFV